jgi:tetratricopeptide (TPR) repeat protein
MRVTWKEAELPSIREKRRTKEKISTEPSPTSPRQFGSSPIIQKDSIIAALLTRKRGDFDSAIADFNETIRLAPKFANGFYNRGLTYSRKNEFDKTIADFSEVIRLEPKGWGGFRSRGTAYYFKNDFDKAIADYNEALRLDANNPWALYLRGKAKQRSGDKSGDADIDKARQLDPSVGM